MAAFGIGCEVLAGVESMLIGPSVSTTLERCIQYVDSAESLIVTNPSVLSDDVSFDNMKVRKVGEAMIDITSMNEFPQMVVSVQNCDGNRRYRDVAELPVGDIAIINGLKGTDLAKPNPRSASNNIEFGCQWLRGSAMFRRGELVAAGGYFARMLAQPGSITPETDIDLYVISPNRSVDHQLECVRKAIDEVTQALTTYAVQASGTVDQRSIVTRIRQAHHIRQLQVLSPAGHCTTVQVSVVYGNNTVVKSRPVQIIHKTHASLSALLSEFDLPYSRVAYVWNSDLAEDHQFDPRVTPGDGPKFGRLLAHASACLAFALRMNWPDPRRYGSNIHQRRIAKYGSFSKFAMPLPANSEMIEVLTQAVMLQGQSYFHYLPLCDKLRAGLKRCQYGNKLQSAYLEPRFASIGPNSDNWRITLHLVCGTRSTANSDTIDGEDLSPSTNQRQINMSKDDVTVEADPNIIPVIVPDVDSNTIVYGNPDAAPISAVWSYPEVTIDNLPAIDYWNWRQLESPHQRFIRYRMEVRRFNLEGEVGKRVANWSEFQYIESASPDVLDRLEKELSDRAGVRITKDNALKIVKAVVARIPFVDPAIALHGTYYFGVPTAIPDYLS